MRYQTNLDLVATFEWELDLTIGKWSHGRMDFVITVVGKLSI
jgi:hypothetical protein